jgi:large subunit ribosomal protein L15
MIRKIQHLVRVSATRSNRTVNMKSNQIADNPRPQESHASAASAPAWQDRRRGGKGQTARSGVRIKGFEGGQMPLQRRLPKRGFRNTPFAIKLNEVNIGKVQAAIDAGQLDAKGTVDAEAMVKAGLMRRAKAGVKLLGNGEFKARSIRGLRRVEVGGRGGRKAGASRSISWRRRRKRTPKGKNKRIAQAAGGDKAALSRRAASPRRAEGEAPRPWPQRLKQR